MSWLFFFFYFTKVSRNSDIIFIQGSDSKRGERPRLSTCNLKPEPRFVALMFSTTSSQFHCSQLGQQCTAPLHFPPVPLQRKNQLQWVAAEGWRGGWREGEMETVTPLSFSCTAQFTVSLLTPHPTVTLSFFSTCSLFSFIPPPPLSSSGSTVSSCNAVLLAESAEKRFLDACVLSCLTAGKRRGAWGFQLNEYS